MPARVLIVSRDRTVRERLAGLLKGAGVAAEIKADAGELRWIDVRGVAVAITTAAETDHDTQLLAELQATTGLRIFVVGTLSASHQAPLAGDRCSEAELGERVQETLLEAPSSASTNSVLHFAGFRLDLAGQVLVSPARNEIRLTRNEYRLLIEFLRRPGRVLSRDNLLQALSGHDAEAFDRSIDMAIARLRRKVEANPKRPTLITTVPGSGYKFTAAVETAPQVGSAINVIASPSTTGERRLITALSVEFSPKASDRFPENPDALRPLIEASRHQAGAILSELGGTLAQDGLREILAYFGHPMAQEHATERAMRAGLAIAENHREDEARSILSCRIGIATGSVVARPDGRIVGTLPNEAIHTRSRAASGEVLIDGMTRQLGGRLFRYQPLRSQDPDQRAGPDDVWHLLGPSAFSSRSETLYQEKLAPLVGRSEERAFLLQAWQRAKSGNGRAVMLSGEPGIGKSRLLAELERWISPDSHVSLRYFCSPLRQSSAFHPIVQRWQTEIGLSPDDTAQQSRSKLDEFLAPAGLSPVDIALFAGMLGLPPSDRFPPPDLSPQRAREQLFALLLHTLTDLARRQPLLMVFEDAHWADQSSLELFGTLLNKLEELPVLLVISFRQDFVPPWSDHPAVRLLTLPRLDRREAGKLASTIASTGGLTPDLLERIVSQAEGVPLFIEELTKALAEVSQRRSPATLPVPETLQASLMTRLDRLPAAKQLAQIGAVIGREFSHTILRAVAGAPDAQLGKGTNDLVDAGLVSRRGIGSDTSYIFKHALVQEIAYGSVLETSRRDVHRRVAEAMLSRSEATAEPEIIAHHFTQAGLDAPAVAWWTRAGELSMRRSAYAEAIVHLETAIGLSDKLGLEPSQRLSRLRLQITYGNALRIARGFGVPETLAAFTVARDLAATLDDVSERFPAFYGLWSGSFLRGELRPMQEMAAACLQDAACGAKPVEMAVAHRICGMTRWFEGRFSEARGYLEHALTLYKDVRDDELAHRFGQDVASPAMAYLTLALWALGSPESAEKLAEEALRHAVETNHIPTVAYAHGHVLFLRMAQRDPEKAEPNAKVLLQLGRSHGLPLWTSFGVFAEGWLRLVSGDRHGGVSRMNEGMTLIEAQHLTTFMPMFAALLAETKVESGAPGAGLAMVETQINTVGQSGQLWYLSELHRRRGEILLRLRSDETEPAQAAFQRAIEIAREQSAKLFELQAAVGLARLWRLEGKFKEARDLMEPICAWFGEAADWSALREARSLLDAT